MSGFSKMLNSLSEKIYKWFGKSSGKMLLATSIIGISMSSIIQAMAILVNNKYSKSQKAFMVPQELGEAMISIIAIFLVTKPIQKFASKLTKTAKIAPENIVKYIEQNKMAKKRGTLNFDFKAEVENIIKTIETSDKFIKSGEKERFSQILPHKKILQELEIFSDSTQAYATLGAGILSTSCVVPLLRNNIASRYQQKNLELMNSCQNQSCKSPYRNIQFPNVGIKV